MEDAAISVKQEETVYRIEPARPDCGNLVTMEMIHALSDALKRLPERQSSW